MKRLLVCALGALFGAVIVHVVAVLAVPRFAESDAATRARELGAAGRFVALPSKDPFRRQAVCVADLERPQRVFAGGDVPFWSVSIVTPRGTNVYSVNDRTSRDPALDLILTEESETAALREQLADNAPEIVGVDAVEAVVVIRALVPDPSYEALVGAFLSEATCVELDMESEG